MLDRLIFSLAWEQGEKLDMTNQEVELEFDLCMLHVQEFVQR
jgi:hypothetical protein